MRSILSRHPAATLIALARIDGQTYRIMGRDTVPRGGKALPALDQKNLEVLPTRTIYTFSSAGIDLGLTFFTPALPDDLALFWTW